MNVSKCIYRLLRWLISAIFIYAGSIKLLEPATFAAQIDAYGLVPDTLLLPVAILLPAIEIIAGIGILFDIRGSLAVLTGLLIIFFGILGYGLHMDMDVDCGCFGPESPEGRALHGLKAAMYRDLVMLALVSAIYILRKKLPVTPKRLPKTNLNKSEKEK